MMTRRQAVTERAKEQRPKRPVAYPGDITLHHNGRRIVLHDVSVDGSERWEAEGEQGYLGAYEVATILARLLRPKGRRRGRTA